MNKKNKKRWIIPILITIGIVLGVSGTAVVSSTYFFHSDFYSLWGDGYKNYAYDDDDDDEEEDEEEYYTKRQEFGFKKNRNRNGIISSLFDDASGLDIANDLFIILNFVDTDKNGKIEEKDGDQLFRNMDLNNDGLLDREEVIKSLERKGVKKIPLIKRYLHQDKKISLALWRIAWKFIANKNMLNMFTQKYFRS